MGCKQLICLQMLSALLALSFGCLGDADSQVLSNINNTTSNILGLLHKRAALAGLKCELIAWPKAKKWTNKTHM